MIQALGKFTTTPGVPLCVSPPTQAAPLGLPGPPYQVHGILVQALKTNSGMVYVGDAQMNRSALTHLYAQLPAPTVSSIPSFSSANAFVPNGVTLIDIWIDVDVPGEGVIVSILVS